MNAGTQKEDEIIIIKKNDKDVAPEKMSLSDFHNLLKKSKRGEKFTYKDVDPPMFTSWTINGSHRTGDTQWFVFGEMDDRP